MNRQIHPRVGPHYAAKGIRGRRIMIVGESSYHSNSGNPGYDYAKQTINVGDDAIGYDQGRGYWNKSRFYTRISRMFGYESQSFKRREEFWNSVLYYNYLQIVLKEARQEPPVGSWSDGKAAFLETIEEYRPEIVISYSKRMWPHLPKENSRILPNDYGLQCWTAELSILGGDQVRLFGFLHPTAPKFYWKPVGDLLRELIPIQGEQAGAAG